MLSINISANQQTIRSEYSSGTTQLKLEQQQTLLNVSITIDREPLKLVYQAAIDRINEKVEPYLGDNAIQKGYEAGIDVSPEATAGRILDFAKSIYTLYQRQHPGEDVQAVVEKFVAVITSGVEQGFAEAKEILGGLGVLEGDIETNIDLTFSLVIEGLAEFARQRSED